MTDFVVICTVEMCIRNPFKTESKFFKGKLKQKWFLKNKVFFRYNTFFNHIRTGDRAR